MRKRTLLLPFLLGASIAGAARAQLAPPADSLADVRGRHLANNAGRVVVATRGNDLGAGRAQDTFVGAAGNGKSFVQRATLVNACSGLSLTYENSYANTSGTDPLGNAILVQASIWMDSAGTVRIPVYFGGQRVAYLDGSQPTATAIESDRVGVYAPAGFVYLVTYVQSVNYVRTITISGSPTGGTFTLTYGGQTATGIAWNATGATVQTAIQALSTGAGVTVTGSAGGPYTLTIPQPATLSLIPILTANSSGLTGGSPSIAIATPTTTYYPLGLQTFGTSQSTGEGAAGATNITDSGSVSSSADTFSYGPTMVRGYSAAAPFVSGGLLGDSIERGTGDLYPNMGFAVRGLGGSIATDGGFPYIMMARGGEKLTDQLAGSGATPLRGFSRLRRGTAATHILGNTATNDIAAGTALATIQANALTLWSQYAAAGCQVYWTTCTPRTNSTDGWRTVVNQSAVNAGQETVRQGWNAWLIAKAPIDPTSKAAVAVGTSGALLAGSSGHPLKGVIDTSAAVEVNSSGVAGTNGGFWAAPTTTYDSGTSSGTVAANATTFTDSGKAWATNVQQGRRLVITGGAGAGQVRTIVTNTGTVLTLTTGWLSGLDATSTYQIDDGRVTLAEPTSMGGFASGIHPSPTGHALMAAPVATSAATFRPQCCPPIFALPLAIAAWRRRKAA